MFITGFQMTGALKARLQCCDLAAERSVSLAARRRDLLLAVVKCDLTRKAGQATKVVESYLHIW